MQETRVQFLGWEDPLEKEMASYSRILAWRNPWTEEPGSPRDHKSRHDLVTKKKMIKPVKEALFNMVATSHRCDYLN